MKEIIKDFKSYKELFIDNGIEFGTGVWVSKTDKVKMKLDSYGKYIPEMLQEEESLSEEEVSLLNNTNYFLSEKNEDYIAKKYFSDIPQIKYSREIGYYNSLYVGHVLEGEYRKKGSSGGFGTWILDKLVEYGYVDAIIHVTKSSKEDILFQYSISDNSKDIKLGSGTKYYPVEISNVLKEIRNTDKKYAVIGLPSFIMELRLLAEIDLDVKEKIPFMIGLVCGHQKTTRFAESMGWQCGIHPKDLKNIDFRVKNPEKPSSQYSLKVEGKIEGNDVIIERPMSEISGGNWGHGYFKVTASDFTDDVMNETADITLGDAWLPEYTKDSKGNNIIIVRNPIIKDIIDRSILDGKVKLDSVSKETIVKSQLAHYRHTQEELGYRLSLLNSRLSQILKRRDHKKNISFIRKKIQKQRILIRDNSHIKFEKALEINNLSYFEANMIPLTKKYKNLYKIQRIAGKLKKVIKNTY